MIELNNISKTWPGKTAVPVLDSVSLSIAAGERVGLMGASGSGKSTLARILLLLEPADSGSISYQGQPVRSKDKVWLKGFRRKVQYISQHPEAFFDPSWKLRNSVLEAGRIHRLEQAEAGRRLEFLLEALQLNAAVLDRYPYQVSGGEIQRAALCRALLLEPELLILDEATSMLDISVQAQILNTLKQLQQQCPLAMLLISHDAGVVNWFAERTVRLKDGCLHPHGLHAPIQQ